MMDAAADYITGALVVGLAADTVLFLWRAAQCVLRYYADKRDGLIPTPLKRPAMK